MRTAGGRFWKSSRWATGAAAALALLAMAAYLALKLTPDWFASDRFPDRRCVLGERSYKECLDTAKARADDRRGVTTATLAIFAGALSAFGAVYTARTFRHNREAADRRHVLDLEAQALDRAGQITERFTRAIDQLGSDKRDVRIGGIYALERIARDSKDDHPQVVEVLTAFVREHAPWPARSTSSASVGRSPEGSQDELSADVQAAMSVIARRDVSKDRPGTALDLMRTDLRGLSLGKLPLPGGLQPTEIGDPIDLHGALLLDANLGEAFLRKANLRDAKFVETDLRLADLSDADLRNAMFVRADLRGADMWGAEIESANLVGAIYDDRTRWPTPDFDADVLGAQYEDGSESGSVPPPD
jgi:hypothetical protein